MNWYKHYSTVKNGLNEEVDRLLKKSILKERCRKVEEKSVNGEEQIEIVNRLWQIIAFKN
jgi:recombinational DNA repair protein RecT